MVLCLFILSKTYVCSCVIDKCVIKLIECPVDSLYFIFQYDDGSPIEGFVLKYRPYYSSDLQLQEHYLPDASARKFKLGSLQPDTEYTVFMHSFNAAGQGPASNDVARKTQGQSITQKKYGFQS